MDHLVASFKEVCGPVWSTETMRKMIAKHGLDVCIGIVLDGGKPDVDLGPADPIIILDEGTPKMDDVNHEAMFDEPPKDVAPSPASPPKPASVLVDLDREYVASEKSQAIEEELASTVVRESPEPSRAVVLHEVTIADDELPVPSTLPVLSIEEISDEDPLRPDPFFSRMTILTDDDEEHDHKRAEMDVQMAPGRKKRPTMDSEAEAPNAKRVAMVGAPEEEKIAAAAPDVLPAPVVPSLADAVPIAPGVPNPRAPSTVSHMSKLRQPTDAEKWYLKSLSFPTRLCDLPPHEYGRMMTLNVASSSANGALLGNLVHWKAIQQAQMVSGEKWRKPVATQRSEVLMIVDADFAFSDMGTPVMDELQMMECPVTSARLPCRNTIVWRRKDPEFLIKASSAQKPAKHPDGHHHHQQQHHHSEEEDDLEPGGMIGMGLVGGMNRRAANLVASSSVGPLTRFQYDIDHCLVVVTPEQWASAYRNNYELPCVDEARRCYPGKHVSVLILHTSSNFKYPNLTHSDAGILTAQLYLRHELRNLMVENGSRPAQLAFTLSQLSKSFAIRPYEFLTKDGPFYSFDSHSDDRTGARDRTGAYIKMLQAAGIEPAHANAIAAKFKSPLALFQAFNSSPNPELSKYSLKTLTTSSGATIGLTSSASAYAAFSADAALPRPYQPLRRIPK